MKLATYVSLETETHGGKISRYWWGLRMFAGLCVMGAPAFVIPVDPARGAEPITAEIIAEHLGFSQSDVAKLLAGEVVAKGLEETTDKQLAIAIAMLMQAEFDDITDGVVRGTAFDVSEAVLAWGDIDPANVDEGAFAGLEFTSAEIAEIEALLGEDRDESFNLSDDENARFGELGKRYGADQAGDPAVVAEVTSAYRQMLGERLRAYMANGLGGIAPYDRGGDSSSAADDLSAAAAAMTVLADLAPELHQAFVDYPNASVDDVDHLFHWAKLKADDRPVVLLGHTMMLRRPDMLVLMERTFYGGHSFNASQVVAGVVPVEEGLAVFYTNRTSTDQVAGFLSSLKRKIGRGMMADGLTPMMSGFRATWSE